MTILKNDWQPLLAEEFKKRYYLKLRGFLIEEYRNRVIYPEKKDIFNALHQTSFKDTKVVILGQDPYHGTGQAHGLSFSVRPGVNPPPSLKNIYKELEQDMF
jgi:uracil-DNA glycosylase